MQFKLRLVVVLEDGSEENTGEVAVLDKDYQRVEHLGLTLEESKEILKNIQKVILEQQTTAFVEKRSHCAGCGAELKTKGHHTISFRTLFGNFALNSRRFYHCNCSEHEAASFSPLCELITERTSPELLFMETKWASLVSYGLTVKALKDFLPVSEKLNASTVRNNTLAVAQRHEEEYAEERVFFIDGCPLDWETLPPPDGPITVGIDGAYLRSWEEKNKNFEVIVGKSITNDGESKCFGFVRGYDEKPRRRLFDLLQTQGMQFNQEIFFMSDGETAVRELQLYLNPRAQHLLDWFHITMRITVLQQYIKGVTNIDVNLGKDIQRYLEKTKWNLWHGKVDEALFEFLDVEMLMYNFVDTYPRFKQMEKAVYEFKGYIQNNDFLIINYGERFRNEEIISTANIESLVNSFVAKRFAKKQQMQWTQRGAHLLLQTRAMTLNGELAENFGRWYPDFRLEEELAQAA